MVTTKSWSSAAAVTLFSFSSSSLQAQGSWSQTPTHGNAPSRAHHAAAYDLQRQCTIVFGGFDTTLLPTASTFAFDGINWMQAAPPTAPPPRGRHAMAYDSARNRVVLFGGTANIFGLSTFDDTWEFDGTSWIQRQPATAPSSRFDHTMAFDMFTGRTTLFGGRVDQQMTGGLDDTWTWDGNDWTRHAVPGPSPRFRTAMAFQLNSGRTLLFGGKSGQQLGDTWEWDGALWWRRYPATSPPARSGHGVVYDLARAVCVLHAGGALGNDTWEWDGSDWTLQTTAVTGNFDNVLVYDARLQRTTLHGGMSGLPGVYSPDVHTYGTTVPGVFTPLGTSCPGSVGTATLAGPAAANGPAIGSSATAFCSGAWFRTFFTFGWSDAWDGNTPLPYDLGAYGMPGCSLQVSRDYVTSVLPVNGQASIRIPIPYDPFLVGSEFFVQCLVLDLAANAGGFTTTNRLKAAIGGY